MLFQHTRLVRHVFCYVFSFTLHVLFTFISPALTKNTRKGRYQHLTPMQKLYVTLQFYATASYLLAAASQIIEEVTNALVAVSPQFIRFPSAEDYPAVKRAFYKLELTRHGRRFANVLGLRA
ncbi:hypothetical protein BDFB_014268, partial [Asbolus verrucosus]